MHTQEHAKTQCWANAGVDFNGGAVYVDLRSLMNRRRISTGLRPQGLNQRSTISQTKTENYPPPPPTGTLSEPDVKLGSLTLIRHKMTLSHFSKGLIRPVSGGQLARAVSVEGLTLTCED